MPLWLLCITYALVGGAAYGLGRFGVVRMGTRMLQHRRKAAPVNTRPTPWLAIILLVASAMVLTIGVMSYFDRRADRAQDQQADRERVAYDLCISEWGDRLVATVNERTEARAAYDRAAAARDDAGAEVFRIALLAGTDPPRATMSDIKQALRQARAADRRADAAKARLDSELTSDYEKPTLACGTVADPTHPKPAER